MLIEFITEIGKKAHWAHFGNGKFKHRKLQWQWLLFLFTKEWPDIYILNQS